MAAQPARSRIEDSASTSRSLSFSDIWSAEMNRIECTRPGVSLPGGNGMGGAFIGTVLILRPVADASCAAWAWDGAFAAAISDRARAVERRCTRSIYSLGYHCKEGSRVKGQGSRAKGQGPRVGGQTWNEKKGSFV